LVEVKPVYVVVAQRSGDWWAVEVPEVPGVFTQAERLSQVEDMAREAIALMLDVPESSFDVEVKPDLPPKARKAMLSFVSSRKEVLAAERQAIVAQQEAVRTLRGQGLTVRDVGDILGVSPQRVSQLQRKGSVPTRQVQQVGEKPVRKAVKASSGSSGASAQRGRPVRGG
jgi:predicted RNase H-like HicB family nuclease